MYYNPSIIQEVDLFHLAEQSAVSLENDDGVAVDHVVEAIGQDVQVVSEQEAESIDQDVQVAEEEVEAIDRDGMNE